MHVDLAYKLFKSQEYERTKYRLLEIIKATDAPPDIEALNLLGVCFVQLNDKINAKGAFEEIKHLQPNFLDAYVHLSGILIQEKDYLKALENLLHYFSRYLKFKLSFAAFDDIIQLCSELFKKKFYDREDFEIALTNFSICLINLTDETQQINLFENVFPIIDRNVNEEGKFNIIYYISTLLGFGDTSPYSLRQHFFDIIMLPLIKKMLSSGFFSTALSLESLVYDYYVKSKETEEHFYQSTAQYVPLYEQYGAELLQKLPAAPVIKVKGKIKIGFFIHCASFLAHIELMVNVLEGIARDKNSRIIPVVYVLTGKDEEMHRRLSNCGVAIVYLSDYFKQYNHATSLKLLLLKRLVESMQVHAIVWVSVVECMAFSFAINIAPVQIWWSMKYHNYCGKNIDGYVTGGSFLRFKELYGRTWRTASTSLNNWLDTTVDTLVKTVKASYSNFRLVLGSLGREQKLTNEKFLVSVAKILKANPDCVFLWTGRHELESISRVFRQYNVIEQTHFIGWVNTKVYAQCIDIFLDSYPFPCGFTIFQAMAAGAATVFHLSDESMETGVNGMVLPAVAESENITEECELVKEIYYSDNENPLYLCASNSEEYIAFANALISDEKFRERVSHANKRFATEVIGDTSSMCEGYEQHFYEVVMEKLGS